VSLLGKLKGATSDKYCCGHQAKEYFGHGSSLNSIVASNIAEVPRMGVG
jgi:hypothetical protein